MSAFGTAASGRKKKRISDREWIHHIPAWPCGQPRLPDEPEGYMAWHDWAEAKLGTHVQQRCEQCRLWHVWELKEKS